MAVVGTTDGGESVGTVVAYDDKDGRWRSVTTGLIKRIPRTRAKDLSMFVSFVGKTIEAVAWESSSRGISSCAGSSTPLDSTL